MLISEQLKQFYSEVSLELKKHKLIYTSLVLLIIIGAFIRSYNTLWGNEIFELNGDDFYHFVWSGYKQSEAVINSNFPEVFYGSYYDAHPPLRNISLNFLLRTVSDLTHTRLVSFIPGLILIPVFFIFGFSLSRDLDKVNRLLIGLFFAFIATFMQELIFLSIGTRPYMLMLNFQIASLIFLILFFKTQDLNDFWKFSACSIIALFSSYGANIIIGAYCLVLLFHITKEKAKLGTNKIKFLFFGLIMLSITSCFQFYQLKAKASVHRYTTLEHISRNYISSIQEIPDKFIDFFSILFQKSPVSNEDVFLVFTIIYFIGLIILFVNKSYERLYLATLPFLIIIYLALNEAFPFSPNRHCLVLLPSVLISYNAIIEKLMQAKLSFILLISGIAYLASTNIFPLSATYHHRFIDYETNTYGFSVLNKADYNFIYKKLNDLIAQNKFIYIERHTAQRIKHFKYLTDLNSLIQNKERNLTYDLLKENINYCSLNIDEKPKACSLAPGVDSSSIVIVYYNSLLKEFVTLDKEVEKFASKNRYRNIISKKRYGEWIISEYNQ